MSKTLLITMMAIIATATAAPYFPALSYYSSPYTAQIVPETVSAAVPATLPAAVPAALPAALSAAFPAALPAAFSAGLPAAFPAGLSATLPAGLPAAFSALYPRADAAALTYGDLSSYYGVPNYAQSAAYTLPTTYGYSYSLFK